MPDRSDRPDPDELAPPIRGPLQGLDDLSDFVSEHPVRTGAFLRGLTVGVLVGGAVAGLSIWRRIQRRERDRGADGGR